VRVTPLTVLSPLYTCSARGLERSRRQHPGNEPSVLHAIHTPQRRDIVEKAAEIVLASLADSFFDISLF
jgi:hypothetical protein